MKFTGGCAGNTQGVAKLLEGMTVEQAINKLEGIQHGIKVFKNMSIKEIAFFLSTIAEFATLRGCYNNCAHCYADAKPPIKEKPG